MKEKNKSNVLSVLVVMLIFFLLSWDGKDQASIAARPTPEETREAYCQFFEITGDSNEVIFTVPANEYFVLLNLAVCSSDFDYPQLSTQWLLTINGNAFIDGRINLKGGEQYGSERREIYDYRHNFPDKCVVVEGGETLRIHNKQPYQSLLITMIGYFAVLY